MPRKPRPGPAKGAPNAGRPTRPGQEAVQLRASARAIETFDEACERLYKACRPDVLRWWIEDAAAGRVDPGRTMRRNMRFDGVPFLPVTVRRAEDRPRLVVGAVAVSEPLSDMPTTMPMPLSMLPRAPCTSSATGCGSNSSRTAFTSSSSFSVSLAHPL